ncbi:Nijmegen breakage syndrome 1 protein [Bienertia sinuspersici]
MEGKLGEHLIEHFPRSIWQQYACFCLKYALFSAVVVSSSCSTDETVVADSDVETETATSNHQTTTNDIAEDANDESERQTLKKRAFSLSKNVLGADLMQLNNTKSIRGNEVTESKSKAKKSVKQDVSSLGDGKVMSYSEPSRKLTTVKNEDLESPNLDIVYNQKLIVRGTNATASVDSATDSAVIDFKRFKKQTNTQSGNSFSNLVPFSKHPYSDSDFDKEVSECVKEEKRRKQLEALAEDLFNNERVS